MESKEDEALQKQSKPTEIQSISSKDSVLSMPKLPAELITEILLRLPVKSLLQFRSVSKSWLSLISSPKFVNTHLLLSASNKDYTHHGVMFKVASNAGIGVTDCSLSVLLHHPVKEVIDLDYPGKNPKDYPWLVGSVNALICVAISLCNKLHDLFIWNPSTRKYNKLPSYRLNRSGGYQAEEPGHNRFGFAYDELQDDYKVVGIFPIHKNMRLCRVEVQIYSLRSNSWRRISDFKDRIFLHFSGKLVKGKLHWIETGRNICSIDLCDEKWAEMEKPCYFNFNDYGHFVLGVLGSDLSVFCNYTWGADIWVMKEYGVEESWTKLFTIKSHNEFMPCLYGLPIFLSNGDILLEIGSRLGKYNPKDDSIKYLDVTNFAPYGEAEIYVKSLICPFFIKGTTPAIATEVQITQMKTTV